MRFYSLHKSRSILVSCYQWFKKKKGSLSSIESTAATEKMEALQAAILEHDKRKASDLAKGLENWGKGKFKTKTGYLKELFFALFIALLFAIVIRQMWFELYEIPTGSMRPTYREQDRLIVVKTAFGLNVPLETSHFFFDPSLVERTGVVIWSGDHIDLPDTDSTYFGLFPYKKRYIKRLMGKPGDTLYFYGGELYGIDHEGNPIQEFQEKPWMKGLEYVPFTHFEGRTVSQYTPEPTLVFKYFNEPAGRIVLKRPLQGQILKEDKWIPDEKNSFFHAYGMDNYAEVRLEGDQTLTLYHHPGLTDPSPEIIPLSTTSSQIILKPFQSTFPLSETHIEHLWNNLYTARFVVQDEQATNYSATGPQFGKDSPRLEGVPNGTYEFYDGKGYEVKWGGYLSLLPSDHPLNKKSFPLLQKLFNLGIRFSTAYEQGLNLPARYAYFRDGDLYTMGGLLASKDDPALQAFIEKEKKHAEDPHYRPFLDSRRPSKETILAHGLHIPSRHYLVLGDNHAMSADSRYFGFVPEANLQGAPSFLFWPPGDRFGFPAHATHRFFNLPNMIVWGIFLLSTGSWLIWRRKQLRTKIIDKKIIK